MSSTLPQPKRGGQGPRTQRQRLSFKKPSSVRNPLSEPETPDPIIAGGKYPQRGESSKGRPLTFKTFYGLNRQKQNKTGKSSRTLRLPREAALQNNLGNSRLAESGHAPLSHPIPPKINPCFFIYETTIDCFPLKDAFP